MAIGSIMLLKHSLGMIILIPIIISAVIVFCTLGYVVFKKNIENQIVKEIIKPMLLSQYFITSYIFVIVVALLFFY